MFFLGIQPNTDLEHRLLEEGYLSAGYNPLMLTPTSIRKLLYNPAPLNKLIAKACLTAWQQKEGSRDPRAWSGSLSQTTSADWGNRPASLCRCESDSRDSEQLGTWALLTLEEILRARRPAQPTTASAEKDGCESNELATIHRLFDCHRFACIPREHGAIMPLFFWGKVPFNRLNSWRFFVLIPYRVFA